jgi:predicted dienelactone hydrolase
MTTTVGCRRLAVMDDGTGQPVPTLVLHPATAPAATERFGPYALDVAVDAPVAGERCPLVVVSHGNGGSPLTHRRLAAHLARHGCVVALPTHPGNHRDDNRLAGTHTILADRPRQVSRVVDRVQADPALGAHLHPGGAAVVGHSLGGYTALALAGGVPTAFPHETPDGQPQVVPVTPDARVRALVLLAPATPWFMAPGALAAVTVPVLMLTAEHDPHTVPWHGQVVRDGLPPAAGLEHEEVAGAGHFSFLSPFPEAMVGPAFPPSQDPPGFDRPRFQAALEARVLAFVRRALSAPA